MSSKGHADDRVPSDMVQRVMGHENVTTTLQLYTRYAEDQGAEDSDGPEDDEPGTVELPVLTS